MAWAGPFSLVPADHWVYTALRDFGQASHNDELTRLSAGSLSSYEIAQYILNSAREWEKIRPTISAAQRLQLMDTLIRLMDEFADTLRLLEVSPSSLKTQVLSSPSASKPTPPLSVPTTNPNQDVSHNSDESPVVGSLPRAGFSTVIPVSDALLDLETRVQTEAVLQALLAFPRADGRETRVESLGLVGPLEMRTSFRTLEGMAARTDGDRISTLSSAVSTVAPSGSSERVPYVFNADVSLPLTEKVRLLAAYSRTLTRGSSVLTGGRTSNSVEGSGWQAGAIYSPGRLSVGASLQSLDADLLEQPVLFDSSAMAGSNGIVSRSGKVQGVAGFVGYRMGPMDVAGRVEGLGDEESLMMLRYTGQVGYRSVSDRLALGLTLTRSRGIGSYILDALNASFGVGYSITPHAQLQLTYELNANDLSGVPNTDYGRTQIVAGRLSVSF